jgi:NAD(P)H-hydrate epimerase
MTDRPDDRPTERRIPDLTADQMREVDRLMIEKYGIELLQMMENAGRHLAALARDRYLDGDPRGRTIIVLAGGGGNGGGGLVAARRLHTWGANVHVWLSKRARDYRGVPGHQLAILDRLSVPVIHDVTPLALPAAELLIDALIGYSLRGDPSGPAAELIRCANEQPAPILSLDVPSGLDATTGELRDPAVRADATLTLALPKTGLHNAELGSVGDLFLGDIGIPPELYAEPSLGIAVGPLFARQEILRL